MIGLPADLRRAIKGVLLATGLFQNDFQALALLVDERLYAWRHDVPTDGKTESARVNAWIEYFYGRDQGYGLRNLLAVVRDELPEDGNRDAVLAEMERLETHLALVDRLLTPDLDWEVAAAQRKLAALLSQKEMLAQHSDLIASIQEFLDRFSSPSRRAIIHSHRLSPDPRDRHPKRWYARKLVTYFPNHYPDERDAGRKFTRAWQEVKANPYPTDDDAWLLIEMPVHGKYAMNIATVIQELNPELATAEATLLLNSILAG